MVPSLDSDTRREGRGGEGGRYPSRKLSWWARVVTFERGLDELECGTILNSPCSQSQALAVSAADPLQLLDKTSRRACPLPCPVENGSTASCSTASCLTASSLTRETCSDSWCFHREIPSSGQPCICHSNQDAERR